MKKILLSAMVLFAAMAVNAQEFGSVDESVSEGLSSNSTLEAGTVLHEGTYVTWTTAGKDTWKTGGASVSYVINGETCEDAGITGSTNPQLNGSNVKATSDNIPDAGAAHNFTVTTDGYLYILAKLNTSKNYVVWEGDGTRIPYIWVASDDTGELDDNKDVVTEPSYSVISFDLSEQDCVSNGIVTSGAEVKKPYEYISFSKTDYAADCQAGIIKIAVKAGNTYTFCGTGTKVAVGGYYFDTTGDATITYTDANDNEYTLLENGVVPTVSNEEGDGTEGDSSVITVSDANYCTFAPNNTVNQTGDITFAYSTNEDKDEMSESHGSVTISQDGVETELTCCLKLNSHPQITFTTTEEMVLTLVFETDENLNAADHTDRCITLDGETQTIESGNVMQVTIEAGDHTLARVSGTEHYLYYVGLTSTAGTGISNAIVSSNVENGAIYNLAGQRLSKLTKGINIVNGKKILVK